MIDTAAPRQSGFRRFLSLINLAAVSAVMLAASGCHKDSFDLDEITRPTTTTAPDPMTLPVVSIATSDTEIIEGGAVTLTITSDLAAPAGGLNVTVDISGADGMDFTSAACSGLRCVVFIPSGSMSVELIITASPGDEAEGSEDWTARIIPTDTLFRINAANGEATFRINDDTLSFAVNDRLRAEYGTQTALAAGEIRNRQSDTVGGVEITGSRYDDEDGNPQIIGQQIEYAAIAAYVAPPTAIAAAVAAQVGQGSTISDFDYAFLGDNRFNPPSTSDGRGTADYDIEGDATYRGVNFFPEGSLTMNFDAATFSGRFSVLGNSPVNYFGDANAMVPDGSGGMRTVEPTDDFDFSVNGDITGDGFEANESGLTIDTAEGFFSALSSFTSASLLGSFYDADGYNPASGNDPIEIAGAGVIENGGGINDLNFGFLGRCVADCLIGVDIAASGPSVVEGQAIMLMVTSDANAPAGGLDVIFQISGNGLMANEFTTTPASVCDSNFVCTVRIPAGSDSANLMLTPLSDFSTEGERWTATLMDGTNYDAAANDNAAFDITDLIAAVGIMTSDTPMEGGAAVTLTITSSETVPTTLTDGLSVTIDISGANANEFTANAVCTNLVCIVTIPAGSDSVNLILTPLSDFSTETESWTATLEDGSNYNLDANDNVVFAITDLIANIRIMTSDTPMEGGAAVTLTITSSETVPTTLTGGLAVTVSIRDADADEFTANAVCTNLVCIVNIPAGSDSVNLILTPLSDFSTETESWTATLEDGSNYNLDANDNVVFDITDLIAAVGIMTSDTPMEGGAGVTLTITSSETVPTTLTDGLSVTINIVGADAADFNNAVCTNLVCIVTIPAGMDSVDLVLSPLSDFSTETGESWTALIVNGDDYDLAANFNVGFDITDLIAAVGIMTSDTARMEGGVAVTLTITSDLAAPAGGLNVTVDISGADGMDFTSAACTSTTPPRCVVRIPSGMRSVELIITPLDTDAVENIERWTAMIVPADTIFSVDSTADDVDFSITDPTFPTAMNGRTLAELMPLDDTPTVLDVDEIRDGGDENGTRAAIPITGLRYDDPNGPQIYVQRLTYAHLGIWTNGQVPTVITSSTATADDFDNDFRYGFFADNAIAGSDFPGGGIANYEVEGDATYRGVNFFLEGQLIATFTGSGGSFISNLGAGGGSFALDDFGSAIARVPDGTNTGRLTDANDALSLFVRGNIANDGFTGTDLQVNSTTSGFFRDLYTNFDAPSSRFSGRFYDNPVTYDRLVSDPDELAGTGVFATPVGMDDLHFGFLGRCNFACDTPNIIGLSSTDSRAQEGGQINLVIMSDTVAPMGGFLVMFEISGADLTEFTLPEADCATNFPVCTVTILETTDSVNLVLSPTDDTTVETTENWMVTLMDGTNFIRDPANNAVAFDITDPLPVPIVSPDRTLADLNFYDTPDTLTAGEIRAGDEGSAGTITGLQYNNPVGLPEIYVQRLQGFAHLGIWVGGEVPTVSGFDHNFLYASLADNAVAPTSPTPGAGIAVYFLEGDATYKGVNFFPDGSVRFNFGTVADGIGTPGMSYDGSITANGGTDENHFGADDARVPDGSTLGRFVNATDVLTINLVGSITADGFVGTRPDSGGTQISTTTIGTASGFFADLGNPPDITSASFSGRFYDSTGYSATSGNDPRELAGAGVIEDGGGTNNLHFGIIGSCGQACGPGTNNIP